MVYMRLKNEMKDFLIVVFASLHGSHDFNRKANLFFVNFTFIQFR